MKGYKKPSKIQATTIGFFKKRVEKDIGLSLVGQSQNGSGKTLAFLICGFESVDLQQDYLREGVLTPQVIIIVPTLALAGQIYNVGIEIVKDSGIMLGQLSGISQECQQESQGKRIDEGHILIGTPQAFFNSLTKKNNKRSLLFTNLKLVCIDEADALFMEEVQSQNLLKIISNRFIS